MSVKLYRYDFVNKAAKKNCVGTHIKNVETFASFITEAVASGEFKFNELGHLHLVTPVPMYKHLVCGSADRFSLNEKNLIIENHRGECQLFIDRKKVKQIPKIKNSFSLIYTIEAFQKEVPKEEGESLKKSGYTHVWIMTRADPIVGKPPVSPYRLAANMAGGSPVFNKIPKKWKEYAKKHLKLMAGDDTINFAESAACPFLQGLCEDEDTLVISIPDGDKKISLNEMAWNVYYYAEEWVTLAG